MARNEAPSTSEIDAMLNKLEQRIEALKKRYRRYFMGLEDRPPNAMRRQVVREVHEAENTYITNTAQKFKLRTIVQKFNTNKTRWNRIKRQIEEGTYHRDRKRARRRQKQREQQQGSGGGRDDVIEIDPEADHIDGLEELDLEEVFVEPVASNNQPAASNQQPANQSTAEKERIKKQRLAEIQKQLGVGGGQGGGQPQQPKQKQPRQPQKQPRQPQKQPGRPQQKQGGSGGNSRRKKKLEKMRQRLDKKKSGSSRKRSSSSSSGGSRTINRSKRSSGGNSSGGSSSKNKLSSRKEKLKKLKRNLDRSRGDD